jgi:hypothetical protein
MFKPYSGLELSATTILPPEEVTVCEVTDVFELVDMLMVLLLWFVVGVEIGELVGIGVGVAWGVLPPNFMIPEKITTDEISKMAMRAITAVTMSFRDFRGGGGGGGGGSKSIDKEIFLNRLLFNI